MTTCSLPPACCCFEEFLDRHGKILVQRATTSGCWHWRKYMLQRRSAVFPT